jgi:outer membrane protein assembly factor BamA
VYAARTANNHTKAFAQMDGWVARNRRHVRVRVEYISYPLPFFGIGANSPNEAEEWYSAGVTSAHGFDQRAIGEGLYVLLGLRSTKRRMRETETDGPLQTLVSAERAQLRTIHLQFGLVHDTRDDISAPQHGAYTRVITSVPPVPALPGASRYVRFVRHTIDARRYVPVGTGPVIALQAQYDATVGTRVPFDHMAMIGADTAMRGYARGRFRDRQAIATQAEFRSGYWHRIGVVTFAAVGAVAPRIEDFATTRWHPAAGLGLRYRFVPPERSTLRLDLAFGRRSIGLNMGINEAF